MEAEARPLPREDTTPPVTKMNLVFTVAILFFSPSTRRIARRSQVLFGPFQVCWSIYFHGRLFHVGDPDAVTVGQGAKLLQPFDPLQR